MTWKIQEFSKITGVSLQTLHYYDRIHLLKPERLENGYRIYTSKNAFTLQRIIALKFLGITLSDIKKILNQKSTSYDFLSQHLKILKNKRDHLNQVIQKFQFILSNPSEFISLDNIFQIIEGYNMSKKLDHEWVKEILTPEELEDYINFEKERENHILKKEFMKERERLISEITNHLSNDPQSEIGIKLRGEWMTLIDRMYTKKYIHLRTKIFEEGLSKGKGLKETGLTPELINWMKEACSAYWKNRLMNIAKYSKSNEEWNTTLDEMFGSDIKRKKEVYEVVCNNLDIPNPVKEWLKTHSFYKENFK